MKSHRSTIFAIWFFLIQASIFAQSEPVNRKNYRIHINQTNEEIVIDGELKEDVWKVAERAGNMRRVTPTDEGYAKAQTEIMLTYDEDNLYLGIICYDPLPGKRPVESLRRDFNFGKNDSFIVFIDTYNDFTNGFAFGLSPEGAQWDGIQANGGATSTTWDTKWSSAVKKYADRWTAEMAIPFRSIRYHGGVSEWGINFSRQDLKTNEKSSWAPMPRQFKTENLAFTGTLVWDRPLPKAGTRFSIIPYISGKATQNYEKNEDLKLDGSTGMDGKIMLSTSMNLDLTVNPEFSQVEVDRQTTNVDRFELFYPEKRQFFLENSDLFANLGIDNIRPFFSRRIGLDSRVWGGARLSGKLGERWRIGLMDMQTGTNEKVPARNFGVAAIQGQVFSRSNITVFMVNKEVTDDGDLQALPESEYNRVAGIEFNLASRDNRWTGKAFYHQSFYPSAGNSASAAATNLSYQTREYTATLNQAWVGKDFSADTGYIQRKGYYEINPVLTYKFFPLSKQIISHGPSVNIDLYYNPELQNMERSARFGYSVEMQNKSSLSAEFRNAFVKLQAPFDPTNANGTPLPSGSEYSWNEFALSYASDIRKPSNFYLSARYGSFYSGTKFSLNGEYYYRWQPRANLAIVSSFNKISLPGPYKSADLVLLGPRFDVTFTDKVFLTTFVQYNNQIDNFNVNIRFQWRFAPVSDLFVVYTQNSYPDGFQTKDRGLAVKVTYWFN